MRFLSYQHFGLRPDTAWPERVATADTRRVKLLVDAALSGRAMVALTGPRGTGKTAALWAALAGRAVSIVEPLRLDRERLHIGDIQNDIVETLSEERPKHGGGARSGQVRRILAAQAGAVALVIDEAHVLHHQTLSALKRLREAGSRGRRKSALAVILVGQADPTERVAEVGLRTDRLALAGLTRAEAGRVLEAGFSRVITEPARAAIAASAPARNWLELQRLVDDCLALGAAAGAKSVGVQLVEQALGDAAAREEAAPVAQPRPGQVAAALNGGQAGRGRVAA